MYRESAAFKDLLLVGLSAILVFLLVRYFDLFERFASWAERHERWQVDEFFSVAVILALVLAIFSYRRWREGRREIAGRVRAEENLRRANDDLVRTNRNLAQRSDENEMFVYSVSHDLRSPLVNLEGFSKELEMAAEELRDALAGGGVPADLRRRGTEIIDEDIGESVRFIRAGVSRLSGIIDALLRFSRAGSVEYRWQTVEVEDVVGRIVDSMRETIDGRGARVKVGDLPPAWGDPVAVEQVFANLVSNAVNYLDPERPGLVEVEGEEDPLPGFNAYRVSDNGVGIPEDQRNKVFRVFQRLDPRAAQGEGLGLAIVRRVVERHGGDVRVESVEGRGSAFLLRLPARPSPPGKAA